MPDYYSDNDMGSISVSQSSAQIAIPAITMSPCLTHPVPHELFTAKADADTCKSTTNWSTNIVLHKNCRPRKPCTIHVRRGVISNLQVRRKQWNICPKHSDGLSVFQHKVRHHLSSMTFRLSDFAAGHFDPQVQSFLTNIEPFPAHMGHCLLCGPPRRYVRTWRCVRMSAAFCIPLIAKSAEPGVWTNPVARHPFFCNMLTKRLSRAST